MYVCMYGIKENNLYNRHEYTTLPIKYTNVLLRTEGNSQISFFSRGFSRISLGLTLYGSNL